MDNIHPFASTAASMSLIHNSRVLYAFAFVSAGWLARCAYYRKSKPIAVFGLTAIIASAFTFNMVIILAISFVVAHVACGPRSFHYRTREGMENGEGEGEGEVASDSDSASEPETQTAKLAALQAAKDTEKAITEKVQEKRRANAKRLASNKGDVDGTLGGNLKVDETAATADAFGGPASPRIDYASTMEGSYEYLDKVLGSSGINKLTADTQKLMHQQQNLFNTMSNMTDMLKASKGMLQDLDVSGMFTAAAGPGPGST